MKKIEKIEKARILRERTCWGSLMTRKMDYFQHLYWDVLFSIPFVYVATYKMKLSLWLFRTQFAISGNINENER
jgi:hypothetical protein